MSDLTFLLDPVTGEILLEGPERATGDALATATALLGAGRELGCARPPAILPPPVTTPAAIAASTCVRAAGYYHHSLIEGPGRRSCALLSGCDLGCAGCWVPHLHDLTGGALVPAALLTDALLDPAHPRDGVSILGGEPFGQPEGLLALVRALRERGCPHILVYTGHTYERLRRRSAQRPAIGLVLDAIQILIDGPYVARLASGAGPWTGSANQRVLVLVDGVPSPYLPAAATGRGLARRPAP